MRRAKNCYLYFVIILLTLIVSDASGQLIDNNQALNPANAGINKTLVEEIGAGRGSIMTIDSSLFIINRDPFRAIRRGRQLFMRKFTRVQGQGPTIGDGFGDIAANPRIGAGLSDSCASCHGRPRGSAGFGGDVATRPDSRDSPHLFGLGLREMLADEITSDLRGIREHAKTRAAVTKKQVRAALISKGIRYGFITANPDGSLDTSKVVGVDPDLRVRPFFIHGGTISIREFIVGALQGEMGLEATNDPDLATASSGGKITTPAGMVLDGSVDKIEAPPPPDSENGNEIDTALVDYMEFYLLNYFNPATYKKTDSAEGGRYIFKRIGCDSCHIPNLQINKDRRLANIDTVFDPSKGIFNRLFATATEQNTSFDDGSGYPLLKRPNLSSFLVKDIYTDFKRHDLGPNFYERNYDGTTLQTQFVTRPLWGVGSTPPYGHDGRSVNLTEVILRHGGEAQAARNAFARLGRSDRQDVLYFLDSLILFPPDDTASNLDPGNPSAPNFPQFGHGSIKLTVLFNDPTDPE